MPMSNSREFVVKVGHVLLLLLMLLLVPQYQAQNIPYHRNNFVPENDLETYENSHIVLKQHEKDAYLYKGVARNFTFSVSQNGYILITVTPCASELSWSLFRRPQRVQENNWLGQQQRSHKKIEQLTNYTGDRRQTYTEMSAPAGVYILDITSLQTDSYVKIYLTTNPEVKGSIYPVVPMNSQVHVQASKRTLVLNWPSGASVNRPRRSIEYCITISCIKNFATHCGALAHVHGDRKPQFATWDIPGEKQKHQNLLRIASPIKGASHHDIFHQCVANKTSFTHTKVKRGQTYYIDVFIIDKEKNTASSYTGTNVTIRKRKYSPMTKMKVGDTKTINLKWKRAVELKLNTSISRLAFEVVPCFGKISFELYHNGTKIRRKTVARHWKRHFIQNAEPGTYLMTFPGKKKKKTFVTILVTSKSGRSRIILPKKKQIFVYNKLITCSNVTIGWMSPSVEHKYCLFKKKVKKKERGLRRRKCFSPEERSKTEKEICLSNTHADSKQELMLYNVTGLQPASWYRFDLFVSRGRSASVPYKSLKIKTLKKCYS